MGPSQIEAVGLNAGKKRGTNRGGGRKSSRGNGCPGETKGIGFLVFFIRRQYIRGSLFSAIAQNTGNGGLSFD